MFNQLSPKSAAIMQQMYNNQIGYSSVAQETHSNMLASIKAARSIRALNLVMKNFYNEAKTPDEINGNPGNSTLATAFENYPQLAQDIERAYEKRIKSLYSENATANTIKNVMAPQEIRLNPQFPLTFYANLLRDANNL